MPDDIKPESVSIEEILAAGSPRRDRRGDEAREFRHHGVFIAVLRELVRSALIAREVPGTSCVDVARRLADYAYPEPKA